jgi:hypothetical protein
MSKFFVPFNTHNPAGPHYTPPERWSDIAVVDQCIDVLPGTNGYSWARRSLSVVTTPSLTGKCLGVASFRNQAGADMVFAGDATKLYRAFSTVTATFTFSSIGGAAYNTASGELWEFAEFTRPSGTLQQRIIATNFSDHIQSIPIRGSTTMTFSDLIPSGTKPKARHIGIISQFLVLGNIDTATSSTVDYAPSRVWWSAFGDPTSFTPSPATQCDFEDLQSGGGVQKVIGGNEYGLIFQQEQVQVMRYIGGTTIFDFSPIPYAPGTPIPSSVIAYGGAVYYISHEGFMRITAGMGVERIGQHTVDDHFWRVVEQTRLHDISVAAFPLHKLIIWAFPLDTAGYAKEMLCFRFDEKRWVRWDETAEVIGEIRKGQPSHKLIAFNTSHQLCTFTSNTPVTAVFSTNVLQPVPGRRWQCNGVRLLMDNAGLGVTPTGSVSAKVMDSPLPSSTPASLTAVNLNAENFAAMRTAGRFQKFSMSVNVGAAGMDNARYVGMEIDYTLLGER